MPVLAIAEPHIVIEIIVSVLLNYLLRAQVGQMESRRRLMAAVCRILHKARLLDVHNLGGDGLLGCKLG